MYTYHSLKKGSTNDEQQLPSMAIYIGNGWLDDKLENYRTLKVSGRETISTVLETVDNRSGAFVLDQRLPAREIVVTYMISNTDNEGLQEDFKELRKALTPGGDSKGQTFIQFNDEPGVQYYGRVTNMETVPDDTNHVISTFTIFCESPYKYKGHYLELGHVDFDTYWGAEIEYIFLTFTVTTDKYEITNGRETISGKGSFMAGTTLELYFDPHEFYIQHNGVNLTYSLDLNSDLENFELRNGDVVESPQGNVELQVRERWL